MDLSGLTSIYTDYMKTQSDNNRLEKMKADWKEKNKGQSNGNTQGLRIIVRIGIIKFSLFRHRQVTCRIVPVTDKY